MKAFLVIDMPSSCDVCDLQIFGICQKTKKSIVGTPKELKSKPDWCPLNPVPKKIHTTDDFASMFFNIVRNICIDEFFGNISIPLKVGDFVEFENEEDLLSNHNLFETKGITTDLTYEKDGEKGYWLLIKSIKESD